MSFSDKCGRHLHPCQIASNYFELLQLITTFFIYLTPVPAEVKVVPSGTLVLLRNAQNITVDCMAYGKPRPSVTWMKGHEEVKLVDQPDIDEVAQVLLNTTAAMSPWNITSRLYLRVAGANYGDAGNYTCKVHNGVGNNASLSKTVEVLCKYDVQLSASVDIKYVAIFSRHKTIVTLFSYQLDPSSTNLLTA